MHHHFNFCHGANNGEPHSLLLELSLVGGRVGSKSHSELWLLNMVFYRQWCFTESTPNGYFQSLYIQATPTAQPSPFLHIFYTRRCGVGGRESLEMELLCFISAKHPRQECRGRFPHFLHYMKCTGQ